jgi:CRP-like cAMP-binding protein
LKNIAGDLEPVTLNPGDILFESGDTGQSMYFVVTGVLVATDQRREKVFGTFHVGDFFGEIALFEERPRTATILAKTYADLYCLRKPVVDKLKDLHIDIYEELRRFSIERDAENIRRSAKK